MSKQGWNEFNTFSKLIYPYLEDELGYPRRRSRFFDEQTYVRKRGQQKGLMMEVLKIKQALFF